MSATQHGYNDTFSPVNSEGFPFSSSQEVSRHYNMLGVSRRHSAPYGIAMVSSVPTQNRKSISNYKIMNEINTDHKRSKSNICGKSGQDFSADNEKELNAKSQVAFDNHALAGIDQPNFEWNCHISKITENDKASGKISDSIASKRESMEYNHAVSGTSDFQRNNTSNLCEKANQSFTCRVCKREISQHASEENTIKCCECSFTCREEVDLQIHSYSHVSKSTCDICKKKHAIGNSHNGEKICPCPECQEEFQCRTLFYEHVLNHGEYYKYHCWVCRRKFEEHEIKEVCFLCCVCGLKTKHRSSFLGHNSLHLPRFFCRLCEEEYSTEEKCLHGRKFTCFDCQRKFVCQTQLEGHYETHHQYSSENCKMCKRSVNDHLIGPEGKVFQCCNKGCLQKFDRKRTLLSHLRSHLREFKCDKCGRRFNSINGLNAHFNHCKTLLFICEICEKRFHSSDILRTHHLVNHR